jgi:HEPN domain-containing protein
LTRKEEEERLLKRSRDFLETSEYQKRTGIYDLAIFSIEQALQLFLKSQIMTHGAEYPRTHSVRVLLEILSAVVPENKKPIIKGILDDYLMELGMLEDAYITSRYVSRDFTKSEAERLTKAVNEIIKLVK